MSVWYSIAAGTQHGPFSDADIREQCRTGQLKRTDHVWKEGEAHWKPVSETELAAIFPPPMPPVAPVPESPRFKTVDAANATPGLGAWKWVVIIVVSVGVFFAMGFLPPGLRLLLIPVCGYLMHRGMKDKPPAGPVA